MAIIRYNNSVNVPAVRTVAERPSPVTRRYNVWLRASSEIEPQVTPGHSLHTEAIFPLLPARGTCYNGIANVPGARKAALPPVQGKWRYNVRHSASPGIGPQVAPVSARIAYAQIALHAE